MAKFRKKPVVIEAEQFWNDRPFWSDVHDCDGINAAWADWISTPHDVAWRAEFKYAIINHAVQTWLAKKGLK